MVYVEDMRVQFGRMKMCNMGADTTEELLAMVDAIGMQRKWIQSAGTYREHFDVCLAKRTIAVAYGAVELATTKDFVKRQMRKRIAPY